MKAAPSTLIDRLATGPRVVPGLFALFIGLRVLAILCAVTPSSDADWYYGHAAQLAAGLGYLDSHGHPTAYWPVGWPWLLSLGFRLGGVSIWTVGAVNLFAAVGSGWLVLDLARRLGGSEGAARLALALFAVYPNAVFYVPLALTEVMYTALLLLGVWLLVARDGWAWASGRATGKGRGWGWTIGAGLVFGLATLVKAQTLVIVPVIFAIMLWREPGAMRRIPGVTLRALAVLAAAGLVIAPWTLRNHRVLGEWVMVSTNGGITLLTGNNDTARGGFTPDDPLVRALDARAGLDEVTYDRAAKALGLAWIETHPARFATLMPLKVWRLWGPDGEGLWAYETGSPAWRAAPLAFRVLRGVNQILYWAMLALFLIAPLRLFRRRGIDWWLLTYGVAAYPTAIAMVFSGQSRFHYPAMPFVVVIAAWWIADEARRART